MNERLVVDLSSVRIVVDLSDSPPRTWEDKLLEGSKYLKSRSLPMSDIRDMTPEELREHLYLDY